MKFNHIGNVKVVFFNKYILCEHTNTIPIQPGTKQPTNDSLTDGDLNTLCATLFARVV